MAASTDPSNRDNQLSDIDRSIKRLEKLVGEKPAKDGWDKLAIVGQLLSGIVVALLGIAVTVVISNGQEHFQQAITEAQTAAAKQQTISEQAFAKQQQAAQLALSKQQSDATLQLSRQQERNQEALDNQKQVTDYFAKILASTAPEDRATLISGMSIALQPADAIRIAMKYAHPSAGPGQHMVAKAAIALLMGLKVRGKDALNEIKDSGVMPDSEIAAAALGERRPVLVRVSEVDDSVDLYINISQPFRHVQYGRDTGWIDVSNRMFSNYVNKFYFLISNSAYEGCGARMQISDGLQQFDDHVYFSSCPPNRVDVRIDVALNTDESRNSNFQGYDIHLLCPLSASTCTQGCDDEQLKVKKCENP